MSEPTQDTAPAAEDFAGRVQAALREAARGRLSEADAADLVQTVARRFTTLIRERDAAREEAARAR